MVLVGAVELGLYLKTRRVWIVGQGCVLCGGRYIVDEGVKRHKRPVVKQVSPGLVTHSMGIQLVVPY